MAVGVVTGLKGERVIEFDLKKADGTVDLATG